MQRRQFITLLSGATAWPLAVGAQQAMPVIGWLNRSSADVSGDRLHVFRRSLAEAGFVEGQNLSIEYRWGDGRNERLPEMAADLVRRRVALIVAGADSAALAAKAETTTIPIVFVGGNDPVKLGLVASLNRPGGNITGATNLNIELGAKRLQMLRELIPTATSVTALVNPTNPSAETITRDLKSTADEFGLRFNVLHASSDGQIDAAFTAMQQSRPSVLAVGADSFYMNRSEKLGSLTARHALPAIFQTREFVSAGGLASYGTSVVDMYRMIGSYVARILKGEKPADLPVHQASKIDLFINLKTAKAFRIIIPLPLLGRADDVIE